MSETSPLKKFEGRKVQEWAEGGGPNPKNAIRVSVGYGAKESVADLIPKLAEDKKAGEIESLIIGQWAGEQFQATSATLAKALIKAATKFTSLKELFLGEIEGEECEISWIKQSPLGPLLKAYPQLEVLYVRGGDGLSIGKAPSLTSLRKLVIQTGGLRRKVVAELSEAHFPALEHLELWLGVEDYGGNVRVKDLESLLSGRLFPKLKYLGLRDSEITDRIAAAIANAPVLSSLETLDLSMGTLSDTGGNALLASPLIKGLKTLNLRHHYMSDAVKKSLSKLEGVKVDVSEQEDGEDPEDRYVSVSE